MQNISTKSNEEILSYDASQLFLAMKEMQKDAQTIYKRTIELKLQDSQEFLNWQDALNYVSYLHEEDL